jgi:hypothetical protein
VFYFYRDDILVTSTLNVTVITDRIVGPLYSLYAAVNLANINDVALIGNAVYRANLTTTVLLQTSCLGNPQGNVTAGVYFNQTFDVPVLPDWSGFVDVSTPTKSNAIASSTNYTS